MPGETRTSPNLTPGITGNEVLKLVLDGIGQSGFRPVYMRVAENLATYFHTGFITLLLVHEYSFQPKCSGNFPK